LTEWNARRSGKDFKAAPYNAYVSAELATSRKGRAHLGYATLTNEVPRELELVYI